MTVQEFLSRLEGVHGGNGQWSACCPAHEDRHQSLSVRVGRDGRILLKCHAGCTAGEVAGALGLTMRDLFPVVSTGQAFSPAQRGPEAAGNPPAATSPAGGKRPARGQRGAVVATYAYTDAAGQLLAQKLRYENKSFCWRRPDGKGGWLWNRDGLPPLLYMPADKPGGVFVVEGEKDVDNLGKLGFTAASGPDGAGPGKWRPEYSERLRGRDVAVIQDNDQPGREYAAGVCAALYGVARRVKLLDLSTIWPEIPEHGDASDLIEAKGAAEAARLLEQLAGSAPDWTPAEGSAQTPAANDPPVKPPDFSDAGNAAVFSRIYRGRLIFADALGWLWWTGKKWERDDHKAMAYALSLSRKMLRAAQQENRAALAQLAEAQAQAAEVSGDEAAEMLTNAKAAAAEAKAWLAHAKTSRNALRIKNMLELSKPALVVKADRLDANPFDLNTPAGIVNLTTGQLRPHDREAYCSRITAAQPGNKGLAEWMAFLDTVTCGDRDLQDFLQMVTGMAFIGEVYQEGIVIACGGGSNGKSTTFNPIAGALGDYSGSIDIKTLTTDRTNRGASLATLRGKRLVVTGELEEHQRLSVATLKQIASTDRMVIEEKYRPPETVKQTHTIVLFTNHLPRVGSTDRGTWRRLIVVPFNATITPAQSVQNYGEVLERECGGAILSWGIEGAARFVRNGMKLDIPEVVAQTTEEYRQREDWLHNFIQERCIQNPNAREGARALYLEYKLWAQEGGEFVRRESDFAAAMEAAGFEKVTPNNRKMWRGLGIDHWSKLERPHSSGA